MLQDTLRIKLRTLETKLQGALILRPSRRPLNIFLRTLKNCFGFRL